MKGLKKLFAVMTAVAVVAVGCFAMTGCGDNKEENTSDLEYVKEKGTLVVGITDFAPMDYKDDNGKWIGFDADLAREFADSLGTEVEFLEIAWDSKELELENKTIDCVWNGMTLTDGVVKAMGTSNPYCNNAQIVVVSKDKASKVKSAKDCEGLAFVVEAGSAGEEIANENGFSVTGVETQSNAVMEVAAGTADACIIDSLMAGAMLGAGTSYPDLVATIELNEELYGVGFRKDSDMVDALNEFFVEAYANGKMMEVAEKYGTQNSIIEQK